MDEREAKLPRWARELLAQEREQASRATARLDDHLTTVEPSPIWYGDWENKIYVPTPLGRQTIYFSVTGEPSRHSHDEVGVSLRKGQLHVNASRGVSIEPVASNCFDLRLKD